MSQFHYLPLSPASFAILAGLFAILVVLIQVGILRYAYMRLGVSSRIAVLLLLASLFGAYFNIPLVELPEQEILSGQQISFFGMRYVVPVVVDWPGTVIAVNVGGALIPTLMSFYLLARNRLWGLGILATICVAAACHWMAYPVRRDRNRAADVCSGCCNGGRGPAAFAHVRSATGLRWR